MAQTTPESASPARLALTVLAWLWVIVPFLYGVWRLLIQVVQLFAG
ncbi:MAG: hypothetical protein J2P20_01330 [Pseudonocardia sp.]|nr:hypothetical protein [Pseudonocardia sp.]MBO0878640.1 hypothetical protein [Pseudonocardia sp.]